MCDTLTIPEASRRMPELVKRATSARERFVIKGEDGSTAAIVGTGDLHRLESSEAVSGMRGLLLAVGALAEFDDLDGILDGIQQRRELARDRGVSFP